MVEGSIGVTPNTRHVTVGTYTREANHHSWVALMLRAACCFFFGHDRQPSFRGQTVEMDACAMCCRIIEVRPTGSDI